MVVIFIFLFVFVFEDDFLFSLVDGWLEYFIGPLVLPSPVIVLILILEIMISDIWVSIGNADIDSFIFENP